MKKAVVLFLLCAFSLFGWTQANRNYSPKNVVIHSKSGGGYLCEPSISVSSKNPAIQVAGAVLNNLYTSIDSGKTWQIQQLSSEYGVYGDPCIINNGKGNFTYFHLSDPENEGWKSEFLLDRIVAQRSNKAVNKWHKGASVGAFHPKDQDKEWAIYSSKLKKYIVTWTQFDRYNDTSATCESNILVSTSKNAKKWSEPIDISTFPGKCLDDDLTAEGATPAVDANGNVFVTWAKDSSIYLNRWNAERKSWLNQEKKIIELVGGWNFTVPGVNRSNGMPVLSCQTTEGVFQNNLYLNWAEQPDSTNTNIYFSKSVNSGETWQEKQQIAPEGLAHLHQFLTWQTIDQATGAIYMVYYSRLKEHSNETAVFLAYSKNGGDSFTSIKINEHNFTPSSQYFFGDYNNISAHNNVVRPIWTELNQKGEYKIVTALINGLELP